MIEQSPSQLAVLLRYQLNLTIPEISARTGLTESVVQNVLKKSLTKKSETSIQAQSKDLLEANGFWVIRTQVKGSTGSRSVATGEPGMPDTLLVGLGHIEFKRPGEPLSDDQERWHRRARESGVCVGTAETPEQALELAREFEAVKRGTRG